eukprot:scaffold89788_cov34-Prasinocladus_malaysianus.AAC.1
MPSFVRRAESDLGDLPGGVGSQFDVLAQRWSPREWDDVAPITITQARLTADGTPEEPEPWQIEELGNDAAGDGLDGHMGMMMVPPGMIQPDPGRPMAPATRRRPRNKAAAARAGMASPAVEIQPGVPGPVAEVESQSCPT